MAQNVTIYTTPTCHYCQLAKQYFKQHGIKYSEIDVAANPDKAMEMIEKSGQMGVPVIDVDGQIIVGFNKPALQNALKMG